MGRSLRPRRRVLRCAVHPGGFRNPFARASQPVRTVALIPARYGSSRFPGKPLADLDGKTMIEHVYRRAAAARLVDAVAVATDDDRILRAVEAFGGIAVLTAPTHASGTDRLAEVAARLACDIIVNVQGDEPLLDPEDIDRAIAPFDSLPTISMTTLRAPIGDPQDYHDPHVVKVVVDGHGDALYFSRAPIPGARDDSSSPQAWQHIGLYAYRRDFLIQIAALPQTPLERQESLEQLRVLEHGFRIRTVEVQHASIGVDVPEDLARVRRLLQRACAHETA